VDETQFRKHVKMVKGVDTCYSAATGVRLKNISALQYTK